MQIAKTKNAAHVCFVTVDLFGVDEDTAANDACRIEHVICKETFEAIKKNVISPFLNRFVTDASRDAQMHSA
jgi:Mn-dependent DtxR family transcriptional regulator